MLANRLKEATLDWDTPRTVDIEMIVRALSSMTHPDVPFVCSNYHCGSNFAEIVNSVSRNIPHTRTLSIRLLELPMPKHAVIGQFIDCLPRFPGLRFFALEVMYPCSKYFWDNEEEEADKKTVEMLGDASPTLEACCLHQCAWRKVNGAWEKYPVEDFMVLAGLSPILPSS
ncbi:hypothetical protein DFH09DRAFT_1169908 [Mycena vulgaris]|nr:hypothetical protein DFH09DRAFT_1169908 [Mycena vulgaris]